MNKSVEFTYRLKVGLLGWFALGLQLYLIINSALSKGISLLAEVVRFFSYFTILSNLLLALCLTVPLVSRHSSPGRYFLRPAVQGAIAVYIIIVGITYSLMLRNIWNPQGRQLAADRLLHDAMPILYVLFWLILVPKGSLQWKYAFVWLIFPAIYLAYTLIRGAMINWYPYPFLDVSTLGYGKMLQSALVMLAGFVVVGLLIIGIDRLLKKRR